jgi:hypothetical protein
MRENSPDTFGKGCFGPEDTRAMALAFDQACQSLGLSQRVDPAMSKAIAEQIIEFAKQGERDPNELSTLTVHALTGRGGFLSRWS